MSSSRKYHRKKRDCHHHRRRHHHRTMRKKGGNTTYPPILGVGQKGGVADIALIGQPWRPPVQDWPGVDGIPGNRNYLAYNMLDVQPSRMMQLNEYKIGGGSRRKGRGRGRKTRHRGGFLKSEIVNLGRDVMFNIKSAYNTINGYKMPVDPTPYKDQYGR